MTETPFYDSLLHDLVGFPARSLVGSRPGHRVTWMGVDITVSAVGPDDTWVEVTCVYGTQSWTKRLDTTGPAALDMPDEPVEDVIAAFNAGPPLVTGAPYEEIPLLGDLIVVEPATPETAPDVYAEVAGGAPEPDPTGGGVADGPPA